MKTKSFFFTFGQSHAHSIAGITYDKDCIVQIDAIDYDAARDIMVETFGVKWAFQYDSIEKIKIKYYPRGIFKLNKGDES